MASPLWFRPVCDDLLKKINNWWANYEHGEIYSTRDWMTKDGQKVDRPTRFVYQVPLKLLEVQHLVAIMATLAPANPLTKDMADLYTSMKCRFMGIPLKNRPRLLASGEWVIKLAWYKDDVVEVLELLLQARAGATETVESFAEQQKKAGKELFEV